MRLNIAGLRNMISDSRRLGKDIKARRVIVYYVDESTRVLEIPGMLSKNGLCVDIPSIGSTIVLNGLPLLRDRKNRKCIIAFYNSTVAWSPLSKRRHKDHLTQFQLDEIVKASMLSDVIGVDYTMLLVAFVLGIGLSATIFSILLVVLLL